MGQKVNPIVFRIGTTQTWQSKWFARKEYAKYLKQDTLIKKYIKTKYKEAAIDRIEIERSRGKLQIIIHTAKPGLIIGRGGQAIEDLRKEIILRFVRERSLNVHISIQEVRQPNLSAEVVLQGMILEIEKRVPYRRVLKRAIENVRRAGAQGVKVYIAGRLNGAEIARTEVLSEGKIPLHTLRANIDYARAAARTTYGAVGIKVWIYKGELFANGGKEKK